MAPSKYPGRRSATSWQFIGRLRVSWSRKLKIARAAILQELEPCGRLQQWLQMFAAKILVRALCSRALSDRSVRQVPQLSKHEAQAQGSREESGGLSRYAISRCQPKLLKLPPLLRKTSLQDPLK